MKTSPALIKGLFGLFENTTLEFTKAGLWVSVSLNIQKEMIPYLNKHLIWKADKYFVYFNRYFIPNGEISQRSIFESQQLLLDRMMIKCRSVKIEILNKQIQKIQQTPPTSKQLTLNL